VDGAELCGALRTRVLVVILGSSLLSTGRLQTRSTVSY
jgi:hypothetical protein